MGNRNCMTCACQAAEAGARVKLLKMIAATIADNLALLFMALLAVILAWLKTP